MMDNMIGVLSIKTDPDSKAKLQALQTQRDALAKKLKEDIMRKAGGAGAGRACPINVRASTGTR